MYSGSAQFVSRPEQLLSWEFSCDFSSSLQANIIPFLILPNSSWLVYYFSIRRIVSILKASINNLRKMIYIYTVYCHVSQWLRRGFGLVNRFIGSSLVVTTNNYNTLKIIVTIAHVTSHRKSSNSSFGHTAVPLELRKSTEVNSHSRIFSYPLGTDHAQKTQFYCCVAQTPQKTSHVIAISPLHWRAVCCLATSYKHSSVCCVRVSRGCLSSLCLAVRWHVKYISWSCHEMLVCPPLV
jgi:hypothetical protein